MLLSVDAPDQSGQLEIVSLIRWREICARAATLNDRLRGRVELAAASDAVFDKRYRAWRDSVARGEEERFELRLKLDHLNDLGRLRAVLGTASWPVDQPLPTWTVPLIEGGRLANNGGGIGETVSDRKLIPSFNEPLVEAARRLLARRVRLNSELVTESATSDLIGALQKEIAALTRRWIHREFQHYLAGCAPEQARDPQSTRHWDAWLEELRRDQMVQFWVAYPVLARMIGCLINDWIDRTAEFIERLESDHPAIEQLLGVARLGAVTSIEAGLADPHLGHRPVLICRFEFAEHPGAAVVYKAKDVRTEQVLTDLLHWVGQRGADAGSGLRAYSRDDYGWIEFAAHRPAADAQEVQDYYRRAGVLVAVIFAIGGNDLHYENLVACGSEPKIVDAETMLHPTIAMEDDPRFSSGEPDLRSVLRQSPPMITDSMLLPLWMKRRGMPAMDISGIGGLHNRKPPEQTVTWRDPETDAAYLMKGPLPREHGTNEVRLSDGTLIKPWEFGPALEDGFRTAWQVLLTHRGELLRGDSPLAKLEDSATRVLMRATMTYARVQQSGMTAERLSEGIDYSIHLELLGRHMLDNPDPEAAFEFMVQERDQLENGDIPFFATRGSDRYLRQPNGDPAIWFRASPLDAAMTRLELLSTAELEFQLSVLRTSLALADVDARGGQIESTRPRRPEASHSREPGGERRGAEPPNSASSQRLHALEAASCLLESLMASARRDHGWAWWPGVGVIDHARYVIERGSTGAYIGNLGISLTLAAAARVLDSDQARTLGQEAIEPLRDAIARRPRRSAISADVGVASGLGGKLYSLTLLAQLTSDDSLLELAQVLVDASVPTDFAQVKDSDLLSGITGLLAGLLTFEAAGGLETGELIDFNLKRLIDLGVRSDGRLRWPLPFARDGMWGYAHGNSGKIAVLATARAAGHDVSGLAEALEMALKTESGAYEPAIGGWPDVREEIDVREEEDAGQPLQPRLGPGWCNGAVGVALSRLVTKRVAPYVCVSVVDLDLDRTLSDLGAGGFDLDKLCCGKAGQAETTRYALTHNLAPPHRRTLEAEYENLIRELSTRALSDDLKLGIPGGLAMQANSLYQGKAGALWAILAALDPTLPCPLTWLPSVAPRELPEASLID